MEVRRARGFLLRETGLRLGRIEEEREDAVQEAGAGVERRDVAIEREVAAAEPQRLLRRGEEDVDDAGEGSLDVRGARARQAVDRRVIAQRFVVVARDRVQAREREQLAG